MLRLDIKKSDGSLYWQEHFNNLNDLNQWLNEERERPYWKQDYSTEIIDITPPSIVKTPLEIVLENRLAEYPSIQQCVEGLLEKYTENRPEKLDALILQRAQVKQKYPKPV